MVGGHGLEAAGASVKRDGRLLLDRVDLGLQAGEMLALVGPNAAGKSTLLRVLSGELVPERGEACCLGRPLRQWRPRELARVRAVLPQIDRLNFPFAVEEVVALGRQPHGEHEHSAGGVVVAEVMAALEISHLAGRRYTDLSGGERRRVQLGRVLAQVWEGERPAFLLLDEHTAGLDLAHQHTTFQLLRALCARGIGVLAVVHDLSLAVRYADRLAVMQGGRVRRCDGPRQVFCDDLVSQVFGLRAWLDSGTGDVRIEPPVSPNLP